MSDSTFDRRQWLTAAAAGIVGGAVGYVVGRRSEPVVTPTPTPTPTPTSTASSDLTTYTWSLGIQGGYGWWFRKDGNKTNVLLLALKQANCTCTASGECFDHAMTLFVPKTSVEVTAETTFPPTQSGNWLSWVLTGSTKFIRGMANGGITENTRTKWDDILDPFGPADPNQGALWNDQVWLPERQKAKSNAESLASASFLLTDGKLAVELPAHPQAQAGRFVFETDAGPKKKALTDKLLLEGKGTDVIGIETAGGRKIFLKAKRPIMPLSIRHKFDLDHMDLSDGTVLPHFTRLFDFVEGSDCSKGKAPKFEKRTDTQGKPTPGELCPPLPLD